MTSINLKKSKAKTLSFVPTGANMDLTDIDLLDADRFVRMEHHEMFKVLRDQSPLFWHEHPDGGGFGMLFVIRMSERLIGIMNFIQKRNRRN